MELDFVPMPPGGGIVNLPAGEWVPIAGGYRRLWGDGVHDDTEAVQAYFDRFDGPLPEGRTYKVSQTIIVRSAPRGSRTPYLVSPTLLEDAQKSAHGGHQLTTSCQVGNAAMTSCQLS
jgi:hypothetical protein